MRFYHWSILSLSCTLSTQIGTARIAHKYRIKNCPAIESHCKSTSLEFTTLRMSIETGNLRLVKVRLQQRSLKYSGLFNFNMFFGAVVLIIIHIRENTFIEFIDIYKFCHEISLMICYSTFAFSQLFINV